MRISNKISPTKITMKYICASPYLGMLLYIFMDTKMNIISVFASRDMSYYDMSLVLVDL